jgi:uncharacterized protein YdhG (YjbR/CyaY superfamily)
LLPPATIDEYISRFPDNVQKILKKIRSLIKKSAPQATEKISYQMPAFYLNGNLVYFAAFAKHIGFYPTAGGISAFKTEIAPFKWAKGTIQFPLDKPIPYDLIRRIVQYRVEENLTKKAKGR